MRKTFNVLSVIALVLTIIGALNWLLVGIFTFNFVTWITFGMVWLERLIYILVGLYRKVQESQKSRLILFDY